MSETRSTHKGNREIVTISLPSSLYEDLQYLCECYGLNRSALIAKAIRNYLNDTFMVIPSDGKDGDTNAEA